MAEHHEKLGASILSPTQGPEIPRVKKPDYEGVRGRADWAFLELGMKKGFETGILPKELSRQYTENVKNAYKSGRSVIHETMHGRFRAGRGRVEVMKNIAQTQEHSRLAFWSFLSGKESIRDLQAQKQRERFIALLRKLPKTKGRKEQDKLVSEIAMATGTKYDHDTVRKMSLLAARSESDAVFVEKVLADENAAKTLQAEAQKTDDAEAAFVAALKASPQFYAEYKQQEAFWNSEEVSDVFGPPQMPGKKVEEARPTEIRQVFEQISGEGITLHVGEIGGAGELHFGNLVRRCAVYRVNGAPKLFIFDNNADRGIRGPFTAQEVRPELGRLQIDEFFSEKFREFATTESEKDPTKIGDQKLLKIVRAFLPNRAEESSHSERLSAEERTLLTNLARIFVTPDSRYPSINSKIELLERILANPQKRAIAAKTLRNPTTLRKFLLDLGQNL